MRPRRLRPNVKRFLYLLVIAFLIGTFFFFRQMQREYLSIVSFQDCLDAGYPAIPGSPESCKIPGKVFINNKQTAIPDKEIAVPLPEKNMNPKNSTYVIEGEEVTLVNGIGTTQGGEVKYFGNELRIDVDGDNKEDTAFLATVSGQGSGTFYYLVVALNKDGGYRGTNGILLGDRIAPQTTEFKNGEIVINYADRKLEEPMTKKPSVGVSRYFKVANDILTEIQK